MTEKEKTHGKFILWIFCLSFAALSVVGVFNYVVDPFKVNERFDFGLPKNIISFQANSQMLRISEFKKHPLPNIVVGDSRANSFASDTISEISGEPFFNLSFPGGTFSETMDAVDFAMKTTDLNSIVMVVSFDFFGNMEKRDSVRQAQYLTSNPFAQYTSMFVTKISIRNIQHAIKKTNLKTINAPDATKEQFWQFMINKKVQSIFSKVAYREEHVERLRDLKRICDEKGIRLLFIIPPAHVEFQEVVPHFNLSEDYEKFKAALAGITETVDFDYVNEWTTDKSVYGDPIHFRPPVMAEIFREAWTRDYRIGRRLDKGTER